MSKVYKCENCEKKATFNYEELHLCTDCVKESEEQDAKEAMYGECLYGGCKC